MRYRCPAARLTNLSAIQNIPTVMYNVDENMYAVNNCGMTFNGQRIQGESSSRYYWSIPYRWKRISLYWGAMGIVFLSVYELEEVRMAWKFRKREKAQRK